MSPVRSLSRLFYGRHRCRGRGRPRLPPRPTLVMGPMVPPLTIATTRTHIASTLLLHSNTHSSARRSPARRLACAPLAMFGGGKEVRGRGMRGMANTGGDTSVCLVRPLVGWRGGALTAAPGGRGPEESGGAAACGARERTHAPLLSLSIFPTTLPLPTTCPLTANTHTRTHTHTSLLFLSPPLSF